MVRQTDADIVAQQSLIASGTIPVHVAVIMDGNGRWAKSRGLNRIQGHREGIESVRDIVEACGQLGIRYLTLYTFSTENWNRPATEVNALMELLIRTLRKEMDTFLKKGVRFQSIGDWSQLPLAAQRELEESVTASAENETITLILALSYSGRWEIKEAMKAIARRARDGYLDPEKIDESMISQALETVTVPDPDLLIRTGGEVRVSNFLLWQIAYSELFFTETYWPDFRRNQLYEALKVFQSRNRRFGGLESE